MPFEPVAVENREARVFWIPGIEVGPCAVVKDGLVGTDDGLVESALDAEPDGVIGFVAAHDDEPWRFFRWWGSRLE